jgi:serine protease AprX
MKRYRSCKGLLAAALLLALLPALVVAGPPGTGGTPAAVGVPAGGRSTVAAPPAQRADVHPRVWEEVGAGGQADVLVVLRAQADLSGADALPTKEAKGRYVYETLRAVAEASQRELRAALDAQQAEYQAFYIVNVLKVRVDSKLVSALAARSDVARIEPNPWVKGIPDSPPQPEEALTPQGVQANIARVHAPEVWALGYTGQGVVVAGQDTGYDWDHPALKTHYRGWNGVSADHDYNWHDAIHENDPHTPTGNPCGFDSPEPCDDDNDSHGTHTMGTMVGDDGGTHQIGIAPGARWIGCRNMEQRWGTPATYMECFEFFLAPYPLGGTPADGNPALAPDVVNNSWSCPPSEGCDSDSLEASVVALRQAGIAVVVSAGNYGSACRSVRYPPAIYQQSFSVGAFDHYSDAIAYFSSRGPVTYGGATYRKPDIAAPGVDVYSSTRGTGYGYMSGTSMAAPHVAGAVALLLSAAPGYRGQVDAVEQLLTRTAEPRTTTEGCGGDGPADVPNNVWGWGILNAFAAVETATAGTLRGTVADIDSGAPLPAAQVTADLASGLVGREILADPMGHYTLTLAASVYDVTADAAGYMPQTITSVAVISGEVTTLDLALAPAFPLYLPLLVKDGSCSMGNR